MDQVDIVLNIINKTGNQSAKIRSDLQKISAEAKKLQASLGLKGLDKKFANQYLKNLQREMKDTRSAWQKIFSGPKSSPEVRLRAGAVAFGILMKDIVESFISSLWSGLKKGAEMFAEGQNTMLGGKYQFGAGFEFAKKDIRAYGENTGLGETDIMKQLLPLIQSGMSDEQARQVREASNDLSVMLGQGNKATDEFIDVFNRIQLREGLQARQLMRMGIQEKTFYDRLSKNTGLDRNGIEKMAAKGKVDPNAIRNTLLQLVSEKEGGKTGLATQQFSKTLGGLTERGQGIMQDFMTKLYDSPGWKKLADKILGVFGQLTEGNLGTRIMLKLSGMFEKLTGFIEKAFTPDNVDAFFSWIESKFDTVTWLIDHFNTIVTIVETLGVVWAGSKIVSGFSAFAEILPLLGTALGGTAASVAAIAAPLAAVGAALGAVVLAYQRIKATVDELGGWKAVKNDLSAAFSGDLMHPGIANTKVNEFSPSWKRAQNPDVAPNNLFTRASDAFMGRTNPNMAPRGGSNKNVTIHAPIEVNMSGGDGADMNHTAQQAAQTISDHLNRLTEQSVDESGNN